MVKVTILVEGEPPKPQSELENIFALGGGNESALREGFAKLLRQRFKEYQFDLDIRPFGTVRDAPKLVQAAKDKGEDHIFLIDLDGPPSNKTQRLTDNYPISEHGRIFFMIQEMEAWILSQLGTIADYASKQGWIARKANMNLDDYAQTLGPSEYIHKPAEKLDTFMQRHFLRTDAQGKKRSKVHYRKPIDGPALLGLLEYPALHTTFGEVRLLEAYILARTID